MDPLRDLGHELARYRATDDTLSMRMLDAEIRASVPRDRSVAPLLPLLDEHPTEIRCHLLFLLAWPEQLEVLDALRAIAMSDEDYLNVAEALAGLLRGGVDLRQACLPRARLLLPPRADPDAYFLRVVDELLEVEGAR